MADVSESVQVAAPADRLYELVSDLPRMGEWSPECTRVTWSPRTAGPAPGARFIGYNRAGAIRWVTQGRVVEAAPGRAFAFSIHFGPIPVSLWRYEFTPSGAGCMVTESWTDHRPRLLRRAMAAVFGNRPELNRRGIHITLARLKAAAEA